MNLSPLQKARYEYSPKLPGMPHCYSIIREKWSANEYVQKCKY